jgi:hypothetical protein
MCENSQVIMESGRTHSDSAKELIPPVPHGHNVDLAMYATNKKLASCRRISEVVRNLVQALSGAGSELQHLIGGCHHGNIGMDSLLQDEDPAVQEFAQGLVAACSAISVSLVGCAVSLSEHVQSPLEELHQCVEVERNDHEGAISRLREKHKACADDVTASLRNKEKLTAKLQSHTNLQDSEAPTNSKDKELGATRRQSWFSKQRGQRQDGGTKFQQVAMQQSLAIEEFAANMDNMMAISHQEQLACDEFFRALGHVDFAVKQTLQKSCYHCAGTWKSAAEALDIASDNLVVRARAWKPTVNDLNEPRPKWVCIEPQEACVEQMFHQKSHRTSYDVGCPHDEEACSRMDIGVTMSPKRPCQTDVPKKCGVLDTIGAENNATDDQSGTDWTHGIVKDARVREFVPAILRSIYAKQGSVN